MEIFTPAQSARVANREPSNADRRATSALAALAAGKRGSEQARDRRSWSNGSTEPSLIGPGEQTQRLDRGHTRDPSPRQGLGLALCNHQPRLHALPLARGHPPRPCPLALAWMLTHQVTERGYSLPTHPHRLRPQSTATGSNKCWLVARSLAVALFLGSQAPLHPATPPPFLQPDLAVLLRARLLRLYPSAGAEHTASLPGTRGARRQQMVPRIRAVFQH